MIFLKGHNLWVQAEKLYIVMQQAGCKPDIITFKTLHKAYTKSKNPLDAERILLDMRKAGVCVESFQSLKA
jgi:pentatricopeptide repeat protein